MPWTTVVTSDIGGREEQQDRHVVLADNSGRSQLLVVADGAGGHTAGALAAQTAIDCIAAQVGELWSSDDPENFLNNLILECNEQVLTVGDGEMACSTLVLAFIRDDQVFWGHVGDSRFYLLRQGEVAVQSRDHSLVELQKQNHPDASVTPSSNQLYMCLGAEKNIDPAIDSGIVRDGDTLLLCSDGFWGQLEDTDFLTNLASSLLAVEKLQKWVDKAKTTKAERSDNITAIAAQYSEKNSPFRNFLSSLTGFIRR